MTRYFSLCLFFFAFSISHVFAQTQDNECQIYPIAMPLALFDTAEVDQAFTDIPLLFNQQNNYPNQHSAFSWVSWLNKSDTPSLVNSFSPSDTISVIPLGAVEAVPLQFGHWLRLVPGVKSSSQLEEVVEGLVGQEVAIPLWLNVQKHQGKDYMELAWFARVQLTALELKGKGNNGSSNQHQNDKVRISFQFKGYTDCGLEDDGSSVLPPVAEDVSVETLQNTAIDIEFNATDPQGLELTYDVYFPPKNGTLSGTPGSKNRIYTPNDGFVGTDTYGYIVDNGTESSNTAVVTIEVLPANTNEAPIADNQSIATNEGEFLSIVLTANDVDGDALTYAVTAQPQNGTLNGTAPNLTYTPNTNFNGSDSFTFTANDGSVDSNVATIAITVNPVNDAPVANTQSVSVNEDESLSIVLTGSDVDGDALTYVVTTQPQNGTLSGTAPNLTYTPNTNFNGSDSFTFTANDGSVDSNIATIAITVNSANDAPVANLQTFSILNTETLSITLTGSDIDGDALTYSIVAQPSSGTLSGTPPNITYTPQDDFVGTDTFTFIANDGALDSAVANININLSAPNRPPQADIQTVNTPSNIAVAIQLTANDLDNNVLTYRVTQEPANGTLSGTAPDVTYTPNSGFTGTDTFKFIANDGFVDSNEATVTVEVGPENQAPVITSNPVITASENTLYRYQVVANDPDGDVLTYALATAPSGMTIDSATGEIQWTPNTQGEFAISIQVSDIFGAEALQSFNVFVTPPLPEITNQGTDFWFMFNTNLSNPDDYLIYIASENTSNITIESPGFSFSDNYVVNGGEVLTISLSDKDLTRTLILGMQDAGIHITSEHPVSVYLLNKLKDSTDAGIVFPTPALGTHYSVATYAQSVNSVGSLFSVVATEDNTQVQITPSIPFFDGIVTRETKQPYTITLNQGQTYQVFGSGALNDLSGTHVESDKPVAVFSGNRCTAIATGSACDHLIEQLTPIHSLGATYYTMPLALRQKGDTVRVYAVEDNTLLTVNNRNVTSLQAGEFYQTLLDSPSKIQADKPIQVMQFSNSQSFDFALTGLEADPFMLGVPSEEQFVSRYLVTTPAQGFPRNFINMIAHISVINSVRLDGTLVDSNLWQNIPGTEYWGAQIEVGIGLHTATANAPFGLYIYGFDSFESYGYTGGLGFSSGQTPQQITLNSPSTSPEVGNELCLNVEVFDVASQPLSLAQVKFQINNTEPQFNQELVDLTNSLGIAEACYTRGVVSTDVITVTVQNVSDVLTIDWQPYTGTTNLSPVIESKPVLFGLGDNNYAYQVSAFDPDNDVLSYALLESPTNMVIDGATGLISWVPPVTQNNDNYLVTLQVTDAVGNTADQAYRLQVDLPPTAPDISQRSIPIATQDLSMSIDLHATDFNEDEQLTWRLVSGEGDASMTTINQNTGRFLWTTHVTHPGTSINQITSCRASTSPLENLEVETKWMNRGNTRSKPRVLVGPLFDSNQDGQLDVNDKSVIIATSDNAAGEVTAIDAQSGKIIWVRSDLSAHRTTTGALINLDNDDSAEFIFMQSNGFLVALNSDGTERWISNQAVNNHTSLVNNAIIPADLDNDGNYELVIAGSVFNAQGQLLWQFNTPGNISNIGRGNMSVVDFNLDGFKEVIYYNEVRDWQGNLLWTIPTNTTASSVFKAHFVYGNFDADLPLEIVVSEQNNTGNYIKLIDDDGSLLWEERVANSGHLITADFNNDNVIEIYLRITQSMYDNHGQVLWSLGGSVDNGATVADIDADGYLDILTYSGTNSLDVISGLSGKLSHKITPPGIVSSLSVPLFVDIDNDGQGEIIATGNNEIYAFESLNANWLPAMKNYSYFHQSLGQVDEQLRLTNHYIASVGQTAEVANQTLPSGRLGDLVISAVKADFDGQSYQVEVLVANRGTASIASGNIVEIYKNDPTVADNKLGEMVLNEFPVIRQTQSYFLSVNDPNDLGDEIFAVIKPSPQLEECSTVNNMTSARTMVIEVTDNDGLTDVESWSIGAREAVASPRITSSFVSTATVGQLYRYQVIAEDDNSTDELRYYFIRAPYGMSINSVTGEIQWTPQAEQSGSTFIEVSAIDLSGRSAIQRFTINIAPSGTQNNAPQITSQPLVFATLNQPYRYDVQANDPDGDDILFALTSAPVDMSIHRFTGEIQWLPTSLGTETIVVAVTDTQGATTEQTYQLEVSSNSVPVISSQPVFNAVVNIPYQYQVVASDADGDVLTYSLQTAPTGMTVSNDGLITWIPGNVQTADVILRVSDASGFAEQSWQINVQATQPNSLPVITSTPNTITKANQIYQYQLVATDADGDTLSYQLVDAPTGMMISNDGLIEWAPTSEQTVPVTVRVADALGFVEQGWSLQVLSDTVVLSADLVVTPEFVNEGDTVSVTVTPMNAVAPFTVTATLDGNPIPLDSNFEAQITASGIGEHIVEATVVDQFESFVISDIFRVRDPNDPAPVVSIASPLTDSVITTPTPITVSVSDSNLTNWRLFRKEAGSPPDEFVLLTEGTTNLTDNTIATLDPTLMLNGQYTLILQATDINGQISEDSVTVTLDGEMKVSHFSVSFEDLNIPMAGLPISIIRTYDTRRSHEDLDFGFGWTVDYQNVRVHESRTPGFGWALNQFASGPLGVLVDFCVQAAGKNQVTVTLPDGDVLEFAAKASPECNQAVAVLDVNLVFEAVDSDNGATLEALDNNFGRLINGSLADPTNPGVPINPQRYKLTTAEGRELILDQGFTIREIKEPEGGNTLTFGEDGIIHSAGESVTFVRDAAGRITKVIAPDATELTYEYDVNGDLIAFTDQVGNRTTYTYLTNPNLPPHYLENIIDPRGIQVARNEYDNDGRLIATIDADGNRIEYTHDISGRVETIKDRNGNPTTYVYNDRGDVLSQTNAEGETTLHTYDAVGHELTRTNALGHTTTWTVDRLGNQLTETDPLGHVTTDTYGGFNQFETSTDEIGNRVISNFYLNNTIGGALISAGPLGQITDALGNVTVLNYDSQTGELSRITDAEGQTTINEYNSKGFQTAMIDAEGVRTDYVVDDMGRRLSETTTRTDSQGNLQTETTSFVYDAKGRLTQTTDAEGNITRTEYNGIDKESAVIDALGRRTEMEYDARGNLVLTRYPDGTTETMVYDAENNLIQETDRLGRVTKMVYDKVNRLVETILPDSTPADDTDNPRSSMEYDVAGRVIAEIDERNLRTEFGYDAADRRTLVRDALGQETQSEYDPRGLRTAMVDARGHRMQFIFDAKSRLVETIYPDITLKTLSTYDKVDRRIAETDQAGIETRYEYDKLGRLTKVIDALNQETSFTYDEQGNKLTQTDAEGRTTRWSYDNLGRVLTRTLPLGQVESFTYDAVGNMLTKTDFNGDVTTYTYDVNDRMVRIDYGKDNSFETFTYDAVGNRLSATNSQGSWTYVYDELNRLIEETKPSGEVLAYQYDANSNKTQLTIRYANGNIRTESMTYDVLNRLETVTDADGRITRYTYDAVGNRSQVEHSNGNKTDYVYDSLNRLTQIQEKRADDSVYQQFDYSLHPTGRRTQITELNGRTSSYTYDNLYRLTGESIVDSLNGDHTASYQYDKVGNRIFSTINGVSTAYTYDANDRLTQAGGEIYTYDAMGNTLTKSIDADFTTYTYNAKQQLTTAEITQGGTTTNASYQYNIDGIRNQKTDDGTVIHFLIDTNQQYAQVVAESDATQQIQVEYLFGDDLLSQKRNNSVFHYHYDGLGSTRLLTNTSGIVTDNYYYDAFGSLLAQFGSTENAYLYTGEQFDSTLDQYYLRARYYNQATGRFTQMDTWMGVNSDPVTLHKYLYANVDPVNMIDPTGNFADLGGLSIAQNQQSTLVTTATISTTRYLIRFSTKLMLSLGAVIPSQISVSTTALAEARKELETKMELEAAKNGRRKTDLVYHYTAFPDARQIFSDQCIDASNEFKHPVDHKFRPSGAYATDIPPWVVMTQKDLESKLFAFPRGRNLDGFVAIDKKGFRHIGGGIPEWYKPGRVGICVGVKAIMFGANLMRAN